MNDQPDSNAGQVKPAPTTPASTDAPSTNAPASAADATKKLSAEEQMAAFEEALKESDWGHQPC